MPANLPGQLGEPMRIDEVTNPLGAAGALAGGVANQLGRLAVKKFTGQDPDELTNKTPDLFQLLMQQPRLLGTPRVQELIKQGLLTPDQVKQIQAQLAPAKPTALSNLSSEPESATNIAKTDRLRVANPQKNATFYKYSDMKWYDEFGNMMPKNSWDQLEKWADDPALGYYEKNYKVSGFRRKNKKGSSV